MVCLQYIGCLPSEHHREDVVGIGCCREMLVSKAYIYLIRGSTRAPPPQALP